jgi:hypothetical protein
MTIRYRFTWWLRIYLQGVLLTAYLTGREPDEAKLTCWLRKGIRINIEK